MSNDITDITITHKPIIRMTEHLGDQYPFTCDSLAVGSIEARVFTPENGRQHVSMRTHGTVIHKITPFTASDGSTCVTLDLEIDKPMGARSVEITLWGITLDTLASAVEAAQRAAAGE